MNYFYYFLFMVITSIVIWFQTVAPIRFAEFLGKYTFVVYLLSLVTGVLYVEATKIGATIFHDAWTLRFLAFSINTILFAILTFLFINHSFDLKTTICMALSIIIVLIQCFWR